MIRSGELVINDSNYKQVMPGTLNTGKVSVCTGLIPRDRNLYQPGYLKGVPAMKSVQMDLIPRSEWSARIKEKVANKAQLSDIRLRGDAGQPMKSLDQNGQGYCWAYGTVNAVSLLRAAANEPYVRLSAHAVGCKVKNFRDEGGWGALSLEYIMQHGVPSTDFWTEKSMDRRNDSPETWANAALHKVTEGWVDLEAAVYDRDLTFDQVATLLLLNFPVVADFNWWGHCVVLMDLVEISAGSFGVRCWNSWGDGWSDRGMGVLEGRKAIPDNAVAPRVVTAAAA